MVKMPQKGAEGRAAWRTNWLRNTKKYYITSETNPSPILGISELEKVIEKPFPAPL